MTTKDATREETPVAEAEEFNPKTTCGICRVNALPTDHNPYRQEVPGEEGSRRIVDGCDSCGKEKAPRFVDRMIRNIQDDFTTLFQRVPNFLSEEIEAQAETLFSRVETEVIPDCRWDELIRLVAGFRNRVRSLVIGTLAEAAIAVITPQAEKKIKRAVTQRDRLIKINEARLKGGVDSQTLLGMLSTTVGVFDAVEKESVRADDRIKLAGRWSSIFKPRSTNTNGRFDTSEGTGLFDRLRAKFAPKPAVVPVEKTSNQPAAQDVRSSQNAHQAKDTKRVAQMVDSAIARDVDACPHEEIGPLGAALKQKIKENGGAVSVVAPTNAEVAAANDQLPSSSPEDTESQKPRRTTRKSKSKTAVVSPPVAKKTAAKKTRTSRATTRKAVARVKDSKK